MSSLISREHLTECTVKNALLWGMCRSHFYQVKKQNLLTDRIVHFVLGIIEAIPLVGQIVSLLERKILLYCSMKNSPFPEPHSFIPQVRLVKCQEKETDICRFWPENLAQLGLTEDQKTEVDKHVRDAFRAGTCRWEKRRLKYTDGVTSIDTPLPITLGVIQDDSNYQVLLFSKIVAASGGERNIRWVYDLTKGTFFLKKRIVGFFEEKLVKHMLTTRISRGIEAPVIWRSSSGKQVKEKRQMIEPVRDGALPILYGTEPFSKFSVKRDLILDLLEDLKSLHEACLSEVQIQPAKEKSTNLAPYRAFHGDLKPSNILVFRQEEKWRGEFCDFGAAAAHPLAFTFSIGYTPPEYVHFYKEKRPLGIKKSWFDDNMAISDFNIRHGQGRDIWSLGLVILSILMNRTEEVIWTNCMRKELTRATFFPPLPSLKACIPSRVWSVYDEERVLTLKQESIDHDLNALEQEAKEKHPLDQAEVEKMFAVVKLMLKINPQERKGIADIFAFLESMQQHSA